MTDRTADRFDASEVALMRALMAADEREGERVREQLSGDGDASTGC